MVVLTTIAPALTAVPGQLHIALARLIDSWFVLLALGPPQLYKDGRRPELCQTTGEGCLANNCSEFLEQTQHEILIYNIFSRM